MIDDSRARLIAARKKLGLSRRQMAAKLRTPRATYEQWETGARRVPGSAVLAAEAVAKTRRPKTGRAHNSTDATIRRLADGRRSAAEVAAEAGISIARVYQATRTAKEAGRPLKFVRSKAWRPQSARNTAIAEAVRQGSTLAEQGIKYGITRQAVQQIALRHGVRASALRKAKNTSATAALRRLADGRRTAAEVAAAAGLSIGHVYRAAFAAKKAGRPLKFVRSAGKQRPRTKQTDARIRRLGDG